MNHPARGGGDPYEEDETDVDSYSSRSRSWGDSEDSEDSEDEHRSESRSGSEEENSENSDSERSRNREGNGNGRNEGGSKSASDSEAEAETETSSHHYLKHITISQDHSEGSGFRNRNLLILKERGKAVEKNRQAMNQGTPPPPLPRNRIGDGWNSGPPPPPGARDGWTGGSQPPPPGFYAGPTADSGFIQLPRREKSPAGRRRERHKARPESARLAMSIPSTSFPPASTQPQILQPTPNPLKTSPQISNSVSQAFLDQIMIPSLNAKAAAGIPDESVTTLDSLQEYIAGLQSKANALEEIERSREPSTYQVIYQIHTRMPVREPPPGTEMNGRAPPPPPVVTEMYFDCPHWAQVPTKSGDKTVKRLKSSLPMYDLPSYIAKHPESSFIVHRDFDGNMEVEDTHDLPPVTHYSEFISACSPDLIAAVRLLLESKIEYSSFIQHFVRSRQLPAPYLSFYHSRHTMNDFIKSLSNQCQRQISILLDYIVHEYEEEYKTADSLLSRNRISLPYVKYLFKPGDILVEGNKGNMKAYYSKSWPFTPRVKEIYERQGGIDSYDASALGKKRGKKNYKKVHAWPIEVWSWKFNGSFRKHHSTVHLQMELDDAAEKDIADLNLRPLSHLGDDRSERLRTRGEIFWKCRFRRFVSYSEEANRYFQNPADERYMIDLMTFRELHSDNLDIEAASPDDLSDELLDLDTPPSGNFIYLLPPTIKGYNLQRKKWFDLQVDRISDVTWNKEAFKSLVLDLKTKDLIEALISNQLDAEKSTDLISGKGNGLILLLHGGPGTGKTLTAESVAEIAEKPLYRVTCGDIGTEPEKVEKYLDSVLHLGKTWGCVVLLDEADVFLEQRGLEDLKRNALVSVFLRVLEYYDGILILTSNRVGTFDEAFKSRIQLALHYANLTQYQRGKVWENFISHLETLGEQNIDFNDLKDHIEQLAGNKMNGREIRNAITTARQYAQWKKTVLTYDHLKDIIEISGRFDKYLDKLNDGYSQDQLAQNEGLRFAGPA